MIDLSRPWPLQANRRGWLLAVAIFVALLVALHFADARVSRFGQGLPQLIQEFFRAVTELGESGWVLIPSLAFFVVTGALGLLIKKRVPRLALLQMTGIWGFLFVAVGLPGLVSTIVKRLIGRGRPELMDTAGPLNFQHFFNDWTYQSFPSGHATTAFALCFAFAFLAPRSLWVMLAIAFLIGLSRIVVGAHYPTDVLAGAVLGTLGAYAVRNFFASRRWVFQFTPAGRVEMRKPSAILRLVRSQKRLPKPTAASR